jgi:hypothetical protein
MPPWDGVLTPEEGDAIHASLISISWDAYKAQQAAQSRSASDACGSSGEMPLREQHQWVHCLRLELERRTSNTHWSLSSS